MAKEKKTSKSTTAKTKATAQKAVATTNNINNKDKSTNPLKGFFVRKYDANENVLTFFKHPTTYAALLAELLGTAMLAMFLLAIGVSNPILLLFVLVAVTLTFYSLSGANFNPLITAGMMATRRMSVIRGVFYMLAQVFGAWLGYGIISIFANASEKGAAPLQVMTKLGDNIGLVILIELLGAIMVGFFFARALFYKKHPYIFSVIVGGGIMVAVLLMLIASGMVQMNNNFILNPAVALTYQILPTSGNQFGEILQAITTALSTYYIIPMIGGIAGFYLSDLMTKLSGNNLD